MPLHVQNHVLAPEAIFLLKVAVSINIIVPTLAFIESRDVARDMTQVCLAGVLAGEGLISLSYLGKVLIKRRKLLDGYLQGWDVATVIRRIGRRPF